MFETLVTGVLTNVMGSFIDPKCFSSDKINIAVWSGYVVLNNLEIKPEVIAHPSLNLVRGVVGSVELKIPWNRLQSESVVLTVDDVYLLVRTEEDIESVLMEMDEFTMKKQLLEQLYEEAKKKQEAEQPTAATKDDGFAARLVNKIIDNIELHIRRIHVRLEDYTTGDHPFAAGLTVESVHAQSTNSNWHPSYVDSTKSNEPRIYKMIELNHLSIYLDPHCDLLRKQRIDFETCSLEEFCHAFNHSIPKRFDDRHQLQLYPTHQRHHFILKPVDASARLIVNRDPFDTSIPKFEVDVSVAEVALRLEESQYCDLLYLASAFQVPEHFKKYQQYRKFRPRKPIFEASTNEWWRYAITAIIEDVRKKKLRWSSKYLKQRREDRIKYQQLWERYVRRLELGPNRSNLLLDSEGEEDLMDDVVPHPHPYGRKDDHDQASEHSSGRSGSKRAPPSKRAAADSVALEALERSRPIEDILFFRYMADKKLDKENERKSAIGGHAAPPAQVAMPPFSDSESVDTETTESTLPTEMRYRSWGKWMFGWTSAVGAAPSPLDSGTVPKRGFPEVELRELFKIVEYEPSKKAKRRQRGHEESHSHDDRDHTDDDHDLPGGQAELTSRVTLSLGKGSITLVSDTETNKRLMRDDPNYGSRYAPTDFLLISFSHLQVAAITKGESTKVDVSLQTIEAFDESADSMAFSRLLTRKLDRSVSGSDDDGGLLSANRMAGPIFLLSYETNPLSVAADAVLFVHMEPLEIVFSPTARCWGRLGSFLNTPQALGLWAELEVASFNDIVNLKARTEAKLNYVMANRVALSVDLRIQAPLIVIPESDSDINCARMVIDLGHINFRTDRLSKLGSDTAALSASSGSFTSGGLASSSSLMLTNPLASPMLTSSMSFVKQLYDDAESGEGAIRWKEEFYDKFTLSVTNLHVLLIPHGKATMYGAKTFPKKGAPLPTSSSLNGSGQHAEWELVERFNINVTLRTSVLPLDATLTRFYVHADLPALTFNLSLEKYFQLLALAGRFGAASTPPNSTTSGTGGAAQAEMPSLGSKYLDEEGRFIPERRPSFLSTSALKKFTAEESGANESTKMTLGDLVGDGNDDVDALSDADSDDTWFSITSGAAGDLSRSRVDGLLGEFADPELDAFSLDTADRTAGAPKSVHNHTAPPPPPPTARPRLRTRRGSATLASGELIDRRLFVCTFTIPVISIQLKKPQISSILPSASFRNDSSSLFDDDVPESGTLLVKLEGFRVRIAKKTLSAQVDLCFRSLDVEDFIEVSGRSSEYLLFSCPTISAPYDLQAPPRRSLPYAAPGGAPRRRASRHRERVLSFHRTEAGGTTAQTQTAAPSGNLLELMYGSSSDRRTGDETNRDLNVRLGAIHVVFDQSYVCSLLELFEETMSKISLAPPNEPVGDDEDDEFEDAIPPPLDLASSVSQEYLLPMMLNESVLADLERARKELFAQQVAQEDAEGRENQSNALKTSVRLSVGVQLASVSVVFCDRADAMASIAVIGGKLQMTTGEEDDVFNIRGVVTDVRLFDLGSAKDMLSVQSRLDAYNGIGKRYIEIFGLERDVQVASGAKLLSVDAVIEKNNLRVVESDDLDGTTAEGANSKHAKKSSVNVRVQPVQLLVQSSFIEHVVNYVIHGALVARFAAKEEEAQFGPRSRRRNRSESMMSEDFHNTDRRMTSPLLSVGDRGRRSGSASPLLDAMDAASFKGRWPKDEQPKAKDETSDVASVPALSPVKKNQVSLLDTMVISFELLHPCIVIPSGKVYSASDEAVVVDFGTISVQLGSDTANSHDAANDATKRLVALTVDGFQISTRSDHMRILEETTLRLEYDASKYDATVVIAVTPLVVNIGERYLCLGVDLWNDVVEPTIQVIESISKSRVMKSVARVDSVRPPASTETEPGKQAQDADIQQRVTVSCTIEMLRLVMGSKPEPEFEAWLRSAIDSSDVQINRESYATAASPASPRKRRHLFSFGTHEEQGGFRSATSMPSIVPVAEIAFSGVRASVTLPGKRNGDGGDNAGGIVSEFSIHEVVVRDVIGDSTEYICDVLARVPSTKTQDTVQPQVKVSVELETKSADDNGSSDPEVNLSCDVTVSSARVCVLPRTLLRIENYVVGVAVSLGQKLAQQDPRIITKMDQHESALAISELKPTGGSINGDLSASQERLPGYGGTASGTRTRKNSMAESMKDGYGSSKPLKLRDVSETIALTGEESSHRSTTKISWTVRAELANLQLWVLSSDRKRDAMGLCLGGRLVLAIEQPSSAVSPPSIGDLLLLQSTARASAISVHLGAPVDGGAYVRSWSHGGDAPVQSFELVESFAMESKLTVRDCAAHPEEPSSSIDEGADAAVVVASIEREEVSPTWTTWREVKSTVSVTPIVSKLSYRDIPVILKIGSALATFASVENHVRIPLAALSAHNDPYLELAALGDRDGDDQLLYVEAEHREQAQQPHRIVVVTMDLDTFTFRLINNLVDEDSPVIGFRVGPLHAMIKDENDSVMVVEVSCSLDAWYHNLRLVVSEPLIEPWSFKLRCTQQKTEPQASGDVLHDDEVAASPWKVTVTSEEFLQWNVTDALVTNILAASRAWEWMSRDGGVESSDRTEYSTYWIRNETGLTLRYWSSSCRESVLSAGQEEPLSFSLRSAANAHDGRSFGQSEFEQLTITRQLYLAVEDGDESGKSEPEKSGHGMTRRWETEFAIPVDQADSRMYALIDLDAEYVGSRVRKCECVIDVLVERGCKVFVVRSTLVLENNTASDLEVEYVPPLRRMGSPPFRAGTPRGHLISSWKAVVKASSTIPVPINLVSAMDGYLMVRPPDMKSSGEGSWTVHLPKAYAKKRVHLPLFDRATTLAPDGNLSDSTNQSPDGEPQSVIKFHRLYGDRPVRPFMMSATMSVANSSLYQRKVLFQPPLVLHNLTAGSLEYCLATPNDWTPATDGVNNPSSSVNLGWEDCQQRLRERGTINVAESLVWHLCDWDTPLELRIRMKGFEWSDPFRIVEDMAEDTYRIRLADLSSSAHLYVSAEIHTVKGRSREVFLFVPYWIVNLTGLKLEYEHDDERAAYEHSTMLLAGQKRLDRDELLLKEEQTRASGHIAHSHLIRPVVLGDATTRDGNSDVNQSDERRRRHPGLIPSIPPIKGLLDLLPKPTEDIRAIGQLEVLQACHSSSQPERGCVRVRVNEVDRRLGTSVSDATQRKWTDSVVLDQPGTSGELEAMDFGLDRVYSIGYSITTAKGRYSRTKVIMLTPRFMIINTMDASVEVCHSSARGSPGIDDQGPGGNVISALNPALHLEPGGYADFHWSLPLARWKTIRCRLAEPGWTWSGAVPLGESREYVVRMRNDSTRATKLIRVVLKQDASCVCVYLREESSNAPPYRIENYSLETFRVHQHRVRRSEILLPHHSLDYAWDEPTQDRVLVVDMLPSAAGDNSRPLRIGSFAMDKIHRFPDALGGTLGMEITADGPTRVLRFTDTRIRAAGGIDASGNASASDPKDTGAINEFPTKFLSLPSFELVARLQGVGVSIVDGSPRELVYVSFAGLSLELYVSENDDASASAHSSSDIGGSGMTRLAKDKRPKIVALRFQMRDFQIDNQLPVTPYPVLLRFSNPSARTRVIDGNVVNIPVVEVCLVKHDGYAGIDFIRHFSLRVLPLHVRVDGSLLYQLLPVFMPSKSSKNARELQSVGQSWDSTHTTQTALLLEEYNASLEVGVDILEVMRDEGAPSVLASSSTTATDRDTVHSHHSDFESMRRPSFTLAAHANHHGKVVSKAEAKKLYFEEFQIDPIRATVSFAFGASAGAMADGLNTWTDSARHASITVGPLRLIINAIGTSLAKIANAPFHLKAISIGHSFIQPDALASRLASHYQSEALRQAYVILGSVDVFGNPMIAWRNMKGGFQDFIYEPVHGISKKSPTEFALGMGRGTYSLVRASVYTFLDFNARILAASSLGLSEACLKLDEYTGYPATRNIYQGFAQGISGIVVSPIRAVELNGVKGVVPGVFAGVFGLVLKPLLGLSLATATTVASLRDAIDPNTKALLMRARPPRHIDVRTRRLKAYSYVESFGEEMVGKLRGGRYRSDGYLGHIDLKQKCLLVTRKRLLFIDVKPGQKYDVVWDLQADEIVLVDWQPAAAGEESGELTLYFIEEDYTPRRRAVLAGKGMLLSKHFVPLPENRVLFVRAMLQQQERSLVVVDDSNNATAHTRPSPLAQRSRSAERLNASWQQHFPSEYPIFHLSNVSTPTTMLTSSRSMANLHAQAASNAAAAVATTSLGQDDVALGDEEVDPPSQEQPVSRQEDHRVEIV